MLAQLVVAVSLLVPAQHYFPIKIDIWTANWCGACIQQKRQADPLRAAGEPVGYIDFDKYKEDAVKRGVTVLPTAILYTQEKGEVRRAVGVQSTATLKAWLDSVRAEKAK